MAQAKFADQTIQNFFDFMDQLEEQFERFEDIAGKTLQTVDANTRKAIKGFEESWDKADSHLQKLAKEFASKEKRTMQEAVVQVHLAEMEAEDALDKVSARLKETQSKVDHLVTISSRKTARVLERISEACHELSAKLTESPKHS